jgi:hypothetical protein
MEKGNTVLDLDETAHIVCVPEISHARSFN